MRYTLKRVSKTFRIYNLQIFFNSILLVIYIKDGLVEVYLSLDVERDRMNDRRDK